jgi:hypothetical protein
MNHRIKADIISNFDASASSINFIQEILGLTILKDQQDEKDRESIALIGTRVSKKGEVVQKPDDIV